MLRRWNDLVVIDLILENPLELIDVSDLMKAVEFKVFSGPANMEDGRVATLHVPGGSKLSRKQIDDYTNYIAQFGARGPCLHQSKTT